VPGVCGKVKETRTGPEQSKPQERARLCLRATTDYWINAMDGQPFLYGNKEVDPGPIARLQQEVIPWLEAHVPRPRNKNGVWRKIPGPPGEPWCSTGKATAGSGSILCGRSASPS
jgi:Transposase protein